MHVPYPVFLGLRLRILGAFTGVLCRLIGRTFRVFVAGRFFDVHALCAATSCVRVDAD